MALRGRIWGQNNQSDIFSFSIGPNGALAEKDTYSVGDSRSAISIFLDHTGSTLYADANDGDSNDYLALSVDRSTGALTEGSDLLLGPGDEGYYSFIGDNQYAYNTGGYEFNNFFSGVQRGSDGSLSAISNFSAPLPTAKPGESYVAGKVAADPTDHHGSN